MTNKMYDILKWIALVLLPAVQVLWLALGKVWEFPYLTEIGATIAAVDVFLGSILGVSGVKYSKLTTQTTFNDDSLEDMTNENENKSTEK